MGKLVVFYGGSGSGKSQMAEEYLHKNVPEKKIYLATMEGEGKEFDERVRRHRAMRQEKKFVTVECPVLLGTRAKDFPKEKQGGILLECISNWVANEMYSPKSTHRNCSVDELVYYMQGEIDLLLEQTNHLVVVTNDLFQGEPAVKEVISYMKVLSSVNRYLCQRGDKVTQVIYGLPLPIV